MGLRIMNTHSNALRGHSPTPAVCLPPIRHNAACFCRCHLFLNALPHSPHHLFTPCP